MSQSGAASLVALHIARDPHQPASTAPPVVNTSWNVFDTPTAEQPAYPDWQALGVEPRWNGSDTSDCAAVLSPEAGPATGSEAFTRYAQGARQRGETILVIACIGSEEVVRSPLPVHPAGPGPITPINLPGRYGRISGRLLPSGVRPQLAEDLDDAERDLGRRLQGRPADAPWWSLATHSDHHPSPGVAIMFPPPGKGELRPILVDNLGEPVAAVWTPDDGTARWFVVPHGTDLGQLVGWLVHKALPQYVPGQMVRTRSSLVRDPAYATQAETLLLAELANHQRAYETRKAELQAQLAAANEAADPLRHGLLYGTGRELEDAVQEVLTAAGFTVTNLDDELGTQSADLLAELDGCRVLVEVKSAKTAAPQNLVDKLEKHVRTWPALRPDQPLDGALLVVNHQTNTEPGQRSAAVYANKAFTASLSFPAIGSIQLLDWWLQENWPAVRKAVLGESAAQNRSDDATVAPLPEPTTPTSRFARWRR